MLELWSKKLLGGEAKLKEPVRFDYTGAVQTFVVPSGVHEITVDCVGASGGRGGANKVTYGGRVTCVLSVIPGEELYLYVGGSGATSGYNGGGAAGSSSSYTAYYRGGGASDIRTISGDLNSRLIVAGGAGASGATSGVAGGNGGGLVGADGGRNRTAYVISGGSQDSGGTCTPADWYTPGSDYAGSFGSGGKGGAGVIWCRWWRRRMVWGRWRLGAIRAFNLWRRWRFFIHESRPLLRCCSYARLLGSNRQWLDNFIIGVNL